MPIKSKHLVPLGLCFVLGILSQEALGQPVSLERSNQRRILLAEFFTSEHCQLCPAAEQRVLGALTEAKKTGATVFFLAFHVDYLNQHGQTDPFAQLTFSQRQFRYAEHHHIPRARAGEVWLNGTVGVAPSDAPRLGRAVQRLLLSQIRADLAVQADFQAKARTVSLSYRVTGLERIRRDFFYFHGAVVENEPAFPGRNTVDEDDTQRTGVVRAFGSVRFDGRAGEGQLELSLPDGIVLKETKIIGYVQDPDNLRILTAAESETVAENGEKK